MVSIHVAVVLLIIFTIFFFSRFFFLWECHIADRSSNLSVFFRPLYCYFREVFFFLNVQIYLRYYFTYASVFD
jgi:hypothetical protein